MTKLFFNSLLILTILVKTLISSPCASKPCGSLPCLESPLLPNGFICQCGTSDFKPVCDSKTTFLSIFLAFKNKYNLYR
jgi:hypothetical protein